MSRLIVLPDENTGRTVYFKGIPLTYQGKVLDFQNVAMTLDDKGIQVMISYDFLDWEPPTK